MDAGDAARPSEDPLGDVALARAATLLFHAVAEDPSLVESWIALAEALRRHGNDAGEEAALSSALSADGEHPEALAAMADLMERRGEPERAFDHWIRLRAAIKAAQGIATASSRRADAYVSDYRADMADRIGTSLATLREAIAAPQRQRFEAAMTEMLGRDVDPGERRGLYVPGLPQEPFFDRRHFAWLDQLESHSAAIRAELLALLDDDLTAFQPYVALPDDHGDSIWSPLDRRLDWGAFHLWRHGRPIAAACARCPRTAAALAEVPLIRLAGRTPNVFFSLFRPGTALPPHAGVSNVRAIVHLPLIVPEDCALRVGGETRVWRAGEALAFDDSIDHEAWNRSTALRAVLILDVWNPHLTAPERALIERCAEVAPAVEYAFDD